MIHGSGAESDLGRGKEKGKRGVLTAAHVSIGCCIALMVLVIHGVVKVL